MNSSSQEHYPRSARCHWFLCELYFAEFCDWVSCTLSYVIEYRQTFPTVFKCLVSNTGQNPTKIKKNKSKQTNASSDEWGIFHPNVCLSPISLNCIIFVWPVKSCIECHSHFISFITDQNSHGFILLWVVSLTSARINAIDSLCHHL